MRCMNSALIRSTTTAPSPFLSRTVMGYSSLQQLITSARGPVFSLSVCLSGCSARRLFLPCYFKMFPNNDGGVVLRDKTEFIGTGATGCGGWGQGGVKWVRCAALVMVEREMTQEKVMRSRWHVFTHWPPGGH